MEHIFYYPGLPASLFMDRILFAFLNFRVVVNQKILCFSCFVIKFKHGFSILAREFTIFRSILMSKIRAQKDRIYSDAAPKMHNFSSPMSKRLCSISPLPTGPFHYFEHKNTKKTIRISFHFKNPRSSCPRSMGEWDTIPGVGEHKSQVYLLRFTVFHLLVSCPRLPFCRFAWSPVSSLPATGLPAPALGVWWLGVVFRSLL
jgi:hypothetical protein